MRTIILLCSTLLIFTVTLGFGQTPPPTNLTATTDNPILVHSVKLAWEYESEDDDATFFVYKKQGGASDTSEHFEKIGKTHDKRFTDYHVKTGTTFSYYVTAVQEEVESAPSNIVEARITPAEYGYIAGVVVSESTNLPLGKCSVKFLPAPGISGDAKVILTDENGKFRAKLKTGAYYLYTSTEWYIGEYYNNVLNIGDATALSLTAGESLWVSVELAKKTPPAFYTLSGSVNNGNGEPMAASVTAYVVNKKNFWEWWRWRHRKLHTCTDSLGNYSLKLKANDTAVVYVNPKNSGYLSEYWNNKRTFKEADRIGVSGNIAGINFTLDPKPVYQNSISGVVTDTSGVTPLNGYVYAYKKVKEWRKSKRYYTETDSTGAYAFSNIEPGNYVVLAWAKGYKPTYFRYDGEPTRRWKKADTVVVTENSVVENINFKLRSHWRRNAQASVYGSVSVSAGGTADAALVYALDANGELYGSAVVDLDGAFEIEGLEAGNYTLYASLTGWQEYEHNGIELMNESENRQADMTLQPDEVNGVDEGAALAARFRLEQNYPNPFNPGTLIRYSLPVKSEVVIKVYNVLGNEVATLVKGEMPEGDHEVRFDGSNLPSGMYFAKLYANASIIAVKKMLLLK